MPIRGEQAFEEASVGSVADLQRRRPPAASLGSWRGSLASRLQDTVPNTGPALAVWIVFAVLAEALRVSHGHYRLRFVVALSLALSVLVWNITRGTDARRSMALSPSSFSAVLAGAWLLFATSMAFDPELAHAHDGVAWVCLRIATVALAVVATLFCFAPWGGGAAKAFGASGWRLWGKGYRSPAMHCLGVALALGILNLVLTLHASPNPRIDVFSYAGLAGDYLLAGENPHTKVFPDLYDGEFDLSFRYMYLPLNTYLFAVARAFAMDVRWPLVFAQLLALLSLWCLGSDTGLSRQTRALSLVVWLSFPVTYFVLEQSWYETLILPLLGFGWVALGRRLWLFAGMLAGLACTTKQYMVLAAVLAVVYVWRCGGARALLRHGMGFVVTFGVVMAPLVAANPEAFFDTTVTRLLALAPRDDALSVMAAVKRVTGYWLPGSVSAAVCLGALFMMARWLWRRSHRLAVADVVLASVVVYGATFLTAKQAFCNYYYLLAFMVLSLAIMLHTEERSSQSSVRSWRSISLTT